MEYKYKLGIDVDGVLRNMADAYVERVKVAYPEAVKSDKIDGYDFPNIDLPIKKKRDLMFNDFSEASFRYSIPYPNVMEEFAKLKTWADENKVKLVCVTYQMQDLIGYTYEWLAEYKFLFSELHVMRDKTKAPVDFLVDDAENNYYEWIESGRDADTFFVMNRDWNQNIDAPCRVYKLTDCIKFIKSKIK